MEWLDIRSILAVTQHVVSVIGILIIVSGVVVALAQYLYYVFTAQLLAANQDINRIRLNLGRILILGLEFIVAADLIGSTTAPDYYTVGLLAIIVAIRTLLTFSINREITSLERGQA